MEHNGMSCRDGAPLPWTIGGRLLATAGIATGIACAALSAPAEPLKEPALFSSSSGILDLLMVAKPTPVSSISFPLAHGGTVNPIGWVYEVCPRPSSVNACPSGAATIAEYGGVRLALQPGDLLKVRLVNRLPLLAKEKVKHENEPGQANLFRNPTNLHTHGLIVAPRPPTLNDPTFGDNVFVEVYNPANGVPTPQPSHQHGDIKMDFVDYRIDIPRQHPSGAFWFHPHVHGLSLNQVSAGLAGIISIGDVSNYVDAPPQTVRHLILKDMQVLAAGTVNDGDRSFTVADGEVLNQQITDFCEQIDKGGPGSRQGFCGGEHGDTNNFIGSRWYFTVNGQVFPTMQITSPQGEIWRLTNASAQVSYQLNLFDDSTQQIAIPMQLIAVDGVSIIVPPGTPVGTIMASGGNRFTVVDCQASSTYLQPVCVRDLIMMPSSRAEVWVTYRNTAGAVVAPPPGATATLVQSSPNLGRAGEGWPQVKLAKVAFTQPAMEKSALEVLNTATAPSQRASDLAVVDSRPVAPVANGCPPLARDHRRRIFFGVENPSDPNSAFGLGYEEVDGNNVVVPNTSVPVSAFDPAVTRICVPLGPGGSTVHEIWELINLSIETHNFHIHQTKFKVLKPGVLQTQTNTTDATTIREDNVPVPFGTATPDIEKNQNGYCTIDQWRSGQCTSQPVLLDVPFSELGDFVFHCHILEHEDAGMMARIRVVAGHP
jgi:L-ascorbate oxidase